MFIFVGNLKTNKMPRTKKVKAPARPLHVIAKEIKADWGQKVNFGAVPYLGAMAYLDSVNDPYGQDSGQSIVAYFLCNASTWRGDVARRVKKELNAMIK
jgi:hypothetical protein